MDNENSEPKDMWDEVDPAPAGVVHNQPMPVVNHVDKAPQTPDIPTPNSPVSSVQQANPSPITPPSDEPASVAVPSPQILNTPPASATMPSRKSANLAWLWILLVVLILGGAGFYVSQHWDSWFPAQQQTADNTPLVPTTTSDVSWTDPTQIASLGLLDPTDDRIPDTKYWKVGTFANGPYKDADLVVMTTPPLHPLFGNGFYHIVKQSSGSLVLLTKESYPLANGDGLDRESFSLDDNYLLPELNFPNELVNPKNSDQKLALDKTSLDHWFTDKTQVKEIFTDPDLGTVYSDTITQTIPLTANSTSGGLGLGGMYLKAPDGTLRAYKLVVPFLSSTGSANITWTSGSNSDPYSMIGADCGSRYNYAAVMPAELTPDLTQTGIAKYSGSSDPIMELTDKNHVLLKAAYASYQTSGGNANLSYDQFVAAHPLFFWTDSFGRIIMFRDNKLLPATECAV